METNQKDVIQERASVKRDEVLMRAIGQRGGGNEGKTRLTKVWGAAFNEEYRYLEEAQREKNCKRRVRFSLKNLGEPAVQHKEKDAGGVQARGLDARGSCREFFKQSCSKAELAEVQTGKRRIGGDDLRCISTSNNKICGGKKE